jgi:spore coat polysaccharide biosynthesis predicted glycosyltransferase SpsG
MTSYKDNPKEIWRRRKVKSKNKEKEILDIYDVEQLINEPTRITATSSTLIDLCLTNTPISKYCEVWCHTRIN